MHDLLTKLRKDIRSSRLFQPVTVRCLAPQKSLEHSRPAGFLALCHNVGFAKEADAAAQRNSPRTPAFEVTETKLKMKLLMKLLYSCRAVPLQEWLSNRFPFMQAASWQIWCEAIAGCLFNHSTFTLSHHTSLGRSSVYMISRLDIGDCGVSFSLRH